MVLGIVTDLEGHRRTRMHESGCALANARDRYPFVKRARDEGNGNAVEPAVGTRDLACGPDEAAGEHGDAAVTLRSAGNVLRHEAASL